jgi:hypothetical protein
LSDEHTSAVDQLVRTSGKMVLLDKLMERLGETGHRVLVFSQVRDMDCIWGELLQSAPVVDTALHGVMVQRRLLQLSSKPVYVCSSTQLQQMQH